MTVHAFPEQQDDTLEDVRERRQALDIASSWIVEAPAGSGKTGLLMQRFLKLLATVDAPGDVLALTFTRKATAEMRDRLMSALSSVHDGSFSIKNGFDRLTYRLAEAVLERDAAQTWRLLERPEQLNIRTIDALCSEIAKAIPLMDGGVGYSRPVGDARPLYRRAAHAVMMRFGNDDDVLNEAVRSVLLHRDGNLNSVESILATMLGTREQWIRLVSLQHEALTDEALDREILPRLNGALERTICAALTELHRCFPEEQLARVAEIARQLSCADGYNGDANPFAPCARLPDVPGTDAEHLDHWILIANLLLTQDGKWRSKFAVNLIKAELTPVVRKALGQLNAELQDSLEDVGGVLHAIRELPPSAYPEEQWPIAKALFRLLRYALDELQAIFRQEDACDFPAVSLAARSILRERADTPNGFASPLRHLLVDEMQDTSSAQYELLEDLTRDWDGSSRTVFLVGDPKQSIYLFREAQVELFQRAMEHGTLGNIPLGTLRLRTNFRSGRHLVAAFNAMFTAVFPIAKTNTGDVTYTPVSAVLPQKQGEELRWHVRELPYRENDTPRRREQRTRAVRDEARSIISCLTEFVGEKSSGRTIAVLTRSRTHTTEVTKELAAAGIPFRAVELETLGQRQEVLDVLAITRALLHLADRTAWLAVLRAPWCGVGVADLFTLAGGDAHAEREQSLRQHLRARADLLDAPARMRVLRTLDVMDAALLHTGTEPLGTRVQRTWLSLGGDACSGTVGRENVRLFLRMLDTMESEDELITSHALDARLENLFAEPSPSGHAVEVMTIHKAKGLEWDMVLVPGTHRLTGRNPTALLDWLELPTRAPDGSRDIVLAPLISSAGEKRSLNEYIRNTRKQRSRAEVKRLLYVAATRARTSLQLFAWPDLTKDGEGARIADTLYGVALPSISRSTELGEATKVEDEPLALAASVDDATMPARKPVFVRRLVAEYDPLAELHRSALPGNGVPAARVERFARPEGSFGARAVGNAIHAFIERLSREFVARLPESAVELLPRQLQQELPSWRPAIRATLLAGGLSPAEAGRAVETVQRALNNFLESRAGRWLLLPHTNSAVESSWRSRANGFTGQIRIDRSFFAGSQPFAAGDNTLWIVDFKTGDHDGDIQSFMQAERLRYEPQLQTYAEVLLPSLPALTPVMLALFYPLMGRLEYWPYKGTNDPEPIPSKTRVSSGAGIQLAQLSLF